MKKLKIGIIGAGNISDRHLYAYSLNDNVEIIAICDKNYARAEKKAKQFDIPYVFSNYNTLLNMKNLDAVSICVWNVLHKEVAISALKNKKHIFLEKPPALNYNETKDLFSEYKKTSGIIFHCGFVLRYSEHAELAKKLIDDNKIGDIYYAKASWLRKSGSPEGWFTNKELSGGGPLIDLGIHMIDLCWYLMGKPRIICSHGHINNRLKNRKNLSNTAQYYASDTNTNIYNVEDFANALISFNKNSSLYVDVSYSLHMNVKEKIEVTLYGEKGSITIHPNLHVETELYDQFCNFEIKTSAPYIDFDKSHIKEINHFVDCCINNFEQGTTIKDSLEIMKVISSIYSNNS